ncbi:MAG: radical SAM protein [Planctomycetota bacterium]|nr:radical SAM protein [Planctomycetota bacterium]
MRIQTFTIVAGSEACNAHCPYCVSRMTPDYDLGAKLPEANWRNFRLGCQFAKDSGVSTVLFTGKGEPTLFPQQLTAFLKQVQPFAFPFVELQTNGIALANKHPVSEQHLREWYGLGLSMIALSIVHWRAGRNREIFQPEAREYFALPTLIEYLHKLGFSVRLSCMMLRGYVDSPQAVADLASFARESRVEQLTVRAIEKPHKSEDDAVARWVGEHGLPPETIRQMRDFLDTEGSRVMELAHGAVVYDLRGQNVCLSTCLTIDPGDERIRQLIFFPDGHLRYDWQYPGAILL